MATSIVTIDAPDKVVTCDVRGGAQQLFNVKNTSGSPVTIGAKVLVEEPAQADWFKVDAPPEQELGDNVLTQIPIRIQVPEACEPGRYTYRLLVYSTRKSGEEFTEGETVAVEVPTREVAPQEPQAKKFPWWIVAVAAVLVLLIGGGATWLFWPRGVVVPDVVGKSLAEARTTIEKAGLQVIDPVIAKPSRDQAPDSVVAQDPAKDANVDKSTGVQLTVAKTPTVSVPSLRGARLASALQKLSSAGLALGKVSERAENNMTIGTVLTQSLRPGTKVDEGTVVNLTVAKKPGQRLTLDAKEVQLLKRLQIQQRIKIPDQLMRELAPE